MKNILSIVLKVLTLSIICIFLTFASSCKKGDEIDNSQDTEQIGTFVDSRDGNNYKWVRIGEQVWMAENLKYLPSVVSPETGIAEGTLQTTPYYYVYGYNGTSVADAKATANYSTYGVLYNWKAAITACPEGWHLPSEAEWTELIYSYLGEQNVAGKLQEIGTEHWESPNTGATNETGFTALPGGLRIPNSFYEIGSEGQWWGATEYSKGYAYYWMIRANNENVYRQGHPIGYGLSVRCVKD